MDVCCRRGRSDGTGTRTPAFSTPSSSYRWQDYYDQRGAVERVNSRLAGGFGFERPGIRGLAKMHRHFAILGRTHVG